MTWNKGGSVGWPIATGVVEPDYFNALRSRADAVGDYKGRADNAQAASTWPTAAATTHLGVLGQSIGLLVDLAVLTEGSSRIIFSYAPHSRVEHGERPGHPDHSHLSALLALAAICASSEVRTCSMASSWGIQSSSGVASASRIASSIS